MPGGGPNCAFNFSKKYIKVKINKKTKDETTFDTS